MQMPNGCFRNTADSDEADMRFVYCAAAIAHMLGSVSFDVDKTVSYIRGCKGYDGGYAQVPRTHLLLFRHTATKVPEMESHGGSTLCALAALSMLVHHASTLVGADNSRGRWTRPSSTARSSGWCTGRARACRAGPTSRRVRRCHANRAHRRRHVLLVLGRGGTGAARERGAD